MDAVKEDGVHTVVVMCSAQVGKTEILLNVLGYHMHHDPAPVLILQPTLQMGEAFSKDRLAPMLRDTPALRGLVNDPRSRDSANTLLHKKFPGGHVTICGANSPASLASRPIRVVLADEIDRYPVSAGTEGDPLNLARKRTATFFNRKIILTSTPTVAGASRIEMAFEESDKRRYFVPCPHCGVFQVLSWSGLLWEKDAAGDWDKRDPVYTCSACGVGIEEKDKPAMLRRGEWRGEKPCEGVAGFHINELYSPWRTWREMVVDWYEAQRDPEMLRVFINTSLGETYEDEGDSVDPEGIEERAELYDAEVPDGALCLVAGIDTQDDRLEATVLGLGKNDEAWVIEHRILMGNPEDDEVWQQLDELILGGNYECAGGHTLGIAAACIDSGGHHAKRVYDYCKRRAARRVYAVKGVGGFGRPMVGVPNRKKLGRDPLPVALYPLGVDEIKSLIYARLNIRKRGPGYIHFPINESCDHEYFEQLAAEQVRTKFRKGVPYREWVQVRTRNEALDCLVYAWAARILLNPKFDVLEKKLGVRRDGTPEPDQESGRAQRRRPVRRGGFVNGWR